MFDSTTSTPPAAAQTQHAYRTTSWSDGCFFVSTVNCQLGACAGVLQLKRNETERTIVV